MNYKVLHRKIENNSLFTYDDKFEHYVRLNSKITDLETGNSISCTRARYLGKNTFMVVKEGKDSRKLGLVHFGDSITFKEISLKEGECYSDYNIQFGCITSPENIVEKLIAPDVNKLQLNCKYIEKGTPVLHSDLQDAKIWGMGGIVF